MMNVQLSEQPVVVWGGPTPALQEKCRQGKALVLKVAGRPEFYGML